MHGSNVFFNPTFQRITGYSDEEIADRDFLNRLFSDTDRNRNLRSLLSGDGQVAAGSDEYEALITCRSDSRLEVIIRISRIFLSEENGTILSFRPVTGTAPSSGIFAAAGNEYTAADPAMLFRQLSESSSAVQAVRVLNQLPYAVRGLVLSEAGSEQIRDFISEAYAQGLRTFADFAAAESGAAPGEFLLLSLGSSGRREMTLFSDQDNALVFRSSAEGEELEKERLYYLRFADRVCSLLNQAGFPYCPGGIMAVNPAWCLSLVEWKRTYREWFSKSDSMALLDIHVFFDISKGWGDSGLADELYSFIFNETAAKPEFLGHFARNCLGYKAPVGMLGSLRTESRDGLQVINIKETMIPLINYARISALRDGITEPSTLGRLKVLNENGSLSDANCRMMCEAFEELWKLRFSNQVFSHGELRHVNDDLDPSDLKPETLSSLKTAAASISAVQSRLSYEFLGVDLS